MQWNETNLNRIMLVEDDPVHARIMKRALESQPTNDHITHLADGESAMAALFADVSLPNIILLDLRLPTIDGVDVLQAIRNHQRTRNIPVIIVSTSERQGDIQQCYRLGANAYITKPVDYTAFIEKLRCLREFWLKSVELLDESQSQ